MSLFVPCPECGAESGRNCVTPSGADRSRGMHQARCASAPARPFRAAPAKVEPAPRESGAHSVSGAIPIWVWALGACANIDEKPLTATDIAVLINHDRSKLYGTLSDLVDCGLLEKKVIRRKKRASTGQLIRARQVGYHVTRAGAERLERLESVTGMAVRGSKCR